jgi:hypothetical protein
MLKDCRRLALRFFASLRMTDNSSVCGEVSVKLDRSLEILL